jgi:release factor glutamine methyltransferase
VDIGTGSGCIAITLAKLLPKAKIYATDICEKALKVALKNAKNNRVKIGFLEGSLLQPLKNKSIDIVATNLPYGWEQWENNTSIETLGLKFEPQKALFTKKDGLHLYRQLFRQIAKRKQKPKSIYGEFDPRQKKDLQKLIKEYLPEYQSKIKKDLAGRDRIFIASLKN